MNRFSDVSVETLARTADALSVARGAEFDDLASNAFADVQRRLGADSVFAIARVDGVPFVIGRVDARDPNGLIEVLTTHPAWLALVDRAERITVRATSAEHMAALALAGVAEMWLVPPAPSIPGRHTTFVGFSAAGPDLEMVEETSLAIITTLVISRAVLRAAGLPAQRTITSGPGGWSAELRANIDALSPREREIAMLVGSGLRVRQVATDLFLSEHTVRNHLRKVFAKLGVSSQIELMDLLRDRT